MMRITTLVLVALLMALPLRAQQPSSTASSVSAALKEYRRRAAELKPEDVEGRYRLACWCYERKLKATARRQLLQVVRTNPEHLGARDLLGHVKLDGRWQTLDQVHASLGHVKLSGRWYRPAAAARLRAAEKERKRIQKLQREVNRLVRHLAGPSEKRRERARDDLIAISKKEKLPHIAEGARVGYKRYKTWWKAYRTALLEVRGTQATLTGLRRRSLSLASGSAVTIELPELKKVRFGTTVGVPLGR